MCVKYNTPTPYCFLCIYKNQVIHGNELRAAAIVNGGLGCENFEKFSTSSVKFFKISQYKVLKDEDIVHTSMKIGG